jgi:hypothetical protein
VVIWKSRPLAIVFARALEVQVIYQENRMRRTGQRKSSTGRKASIGVEDKRAAMLLKRIQDDPVERYGMVYYLALNLQREETAKR